MKIKKILFSQNPPVNIAKTPYANLISKHNVKIDFFKFFQIQRISVSQFKKNKISFSDFTTMVFTTRYSVDHFFSLLRESKMEFPADIKFCCINESTALYLQKYVNYRKRRMTHAKGSIETLAKILEENNDKERYLIPCSIDSCVNPLITLLDEKKINYEKAEVFQIVMADLSQVNIEEYDMIVFFSPFGIESLKINFPNYQQGNTIIGALGYQVLDVAAQEGLRVDIMAPTPEQPSIFTAIDQYIQKNK